MAVSRIGAPALPLGYTGNASPLNRTGVEAVQADSLMVVLITTFSTWDIMTVGWGASPLVELGHSDDGGSRVSSGIYYLANPAVESRTLAISQAGAGRTTVTVAFYAGVDLDEPWADLGAGNRYLVAQAQSTAPSIALGTVAAGDAAIGLAGRQTGTTTGELEGVSGEISDLEILGSSASNGNAGSAQEVAGAGAAVTLNWTCLHAWWSTIGGVLRAAGDAPPPASNAGGLTLVGCA